MAYVYLNTEQSSSDNRQSMWTNKWLSERDKHSHMQLLREIRENNPDYFRNYLQMNNTTFDHLLNMVKPYVTK
jgi:hypothetical protein